MISDLMDHYDFHDPAVCVECLGLTGTFNLNQLEAVMRMLIQDGYMTPAARHVIRKLYPKDEARESTALSERERWAYGSGPGTLAGNEDL